MMMAPLLAMVAVAKPLAPEGIAFACVAVAIALTVMVTLYTIWPNWSWEKRRR